MTNEYESEEIHIGRQDFVPVLKGFAPVVAIYINEETDMIVVKSEHVKKTLPQKEADDLIKMIFEEMSHQKGQNNE